jgi:hypothetical protein
MGTASPDARSGDPLDRLLISSRNASSAVSPISASGSVVKEDNGAVACRIANDALVPVANVAIEVEVLDGTLR